MLKLSNLGQISKTMLVAVATSIALTACSKVGPFSGSSNYQPFHNLDKNQYQNTAQKLNSKGAIVIKQRGSVQIVLTARKLFYKNTLHLKPGQGKTLDYVATLVKHAPDSKIRVIGFSNYIPNSRDQYQQSHKMAATIAAQLWKRGVPSTQKLTIIGHADKQPVSGSLTAAGNAQNERVEVLIN